MAAEGKGKELATSVSEVVMGAETVAEKREATTTSETTPQETQTCNIFPPGLGVKLGNGGIILVLFETPSGFAIFSYDGVSLLQPNAIEDIWGDFIICGRAKSIASLRGFQTFENKTIAIDPVTGVNKQLAKMIRDNIVPGQKLAVGKPEYKKIIEDKLEIPCLFDNTIMELMWGLKNCLQYLVPEEKMKLTREDRLQMSEGMKMVLKHFDVEVKPEIVNQDIIEAAYGIYCCDRVVNRHTDNLRAAGKHLKEISGIDTQDWNLVKLAGALKLMFYPEEEFPAAEEIFSEVYSKLVKDGPLYKGKIFKMPCKIIFEEIFEARRFRNELIDLLFYEVKKAREAYNNEQ